MTVINFFETENREHWLSEIGKCEWKAAKLLYDWLKTGKFFEATGGTSKVLLVVDGDQLVSFCTYAERDDVHPTVFSPWMGFIYTFPEFRGNRYVGLLFDAVGKLAKAENISEVFISTNHIGLYEKYGCEFKCELPDINGDNTRIYVKNFA